ncbi:MAG: O-antigen ligase family protein [Tepidisphaeraceae bacterium]
MTAIERSLTSPAPQALAQPEVEPAVAFGDRFLKFFACVLLGYAIGGRGFAYIGIPPLFIGEITLLFGIVAFVRCRAWHWIFTETRTWPVLAMCAWGAARTIPYISAYGIDSIRDAMVWGYSAFALVLATLLAEHPRRLAQWIARYRRFVPTFLVGIIIAFAIYRFLGQGRPEWPWVSVPIVQVKEGDVLVHLAGVMAFWVAGFGGAVPWKWPVLLTFNAAVMGVIDRAGMVAFGVVFMLCMALRPLHVIALRVIGVVLLVVVILWATDINIPIYGGKGRDISFDQIVTNLDSVLFDTGSDGLDSTKEWRIDWWKEIRRYTIYGRYFWTGKGYGINLADDDGFQVLSDNSLRNPHSVHMTMLARGGVPGLTLWILVQLSWGSGVFFSLLRARRECRREWQGVFFFLMCYWIALLINGSFDVFLEGPMGGIWFWAVYGTGLGAMTIFRRDPDAFHMPPLPSPPVSEESL